MLKPKKYLKSKHAVNFIQRHTQCSRNTALTVLTLIKTNLDDPYFSMGINNGYRAFWNRPTQTLAIGIEDQFGGMFVLIDG